MLDPRAQIVELWRQVSREMHDRFRLAFRNTDMTLMALVLLRQIGLEQGISVSELARRCGSAKSHVSTTVDQLVRQGYLEKRPDPVDQRLSRIYLAPATVTTMAKIEEHAQNVWSEIMTGLPNDEAEEIARGLHTLLAAMERSRTSTAGEPTP